MKFIVFSLLLLSLASLKCEEAYAQIYSTTIQRPANIVGSLIIGENIATIKNFEATPNNDALICKIKGIYFVSSSLQPAALYPGINGHLGFWFELNNKPISASTNRSYVTEHMPIILATSPFLIALDQGDTIGTRFASTGPNIGITYIDPPSNSEPSIASYTLSIYKVDN